MPLLYHAYVYLEFLILACTIYILAPTEACKELIHYLFDTKGISEVFGDCDVRNEASWKLMERLGFERMQRLDNQSYKNDVNGQPIIIQTYLYGRKKSHPIKKQDKSKSSRNL